jgi:hypothetical protein
VAPGDGGATREPVFRDDPDTPLPFFGLFEALLPRKRGLSNDDFFLLLPNILLLLLDLDDFLALFFAVGSGGDDINALSPKPPPLPPNPNPIGALIFLLYKCV